MNIKQLFSGLVTNEKEVEKQASNMDAFLNKALEHYCEGCGKFFKIKPTTHKKTCLKNG